MRLMLLTLMLTLPLAAGATRLDPNICAATVGGAANYRRGFPAWNFGDPGRPMLRRTLTGVNARCNDGSPAIMYLRPAPAGGETNKWVIHFDGGGGCSSGQECLERWCGVSGTSFDQAAKMSSLGAPESREDQGGILNELAGGPFSDFNHVFLPYCSSDNWVGSASVGSPIDPSTGLPPTYDIEFQGENIVADALATLRAASTTVDPLAAANFFPYVMPDLDNATLVIVSGDSAGGGGARHHVDRIAAALASVPEVVLVVDAGFAPALYDPLPWGGPNIWNGSNPLNPYVDYADMMTQERVPVMRGFWGVDDSALDQSCLTTAPTPSLHCLDTDWVLKHHITTPFFVHQDLTDPLPMPRYAAWGIFPSSFEYAVATAAQLNDVLAPGLEARGGPAGVLGLNCNNHTASRTTSKFNNWRVIGVPGTVPFHLTLDQWIGGIAATDIQPDDPTTAGYSSSLCP